MSISCTQFTLFHPLVQIFYTCAIYTIYPTIRLSYPSSSPSQQFLFSYFVKFQVYENLSPMFFLPSSSYSQFWPPTFLWHAKIQPLKSSFSHKQWKYNITIKYFFTIKVLHFSPNTLCEQFKKQLRVTKKYSHPTKFLKTNMDGNFGVLRRGHVQGKEST